MFIGCFMIKKELVVWINNNADEEKMQKTRINDRHQKLREKLKSEKTTKSHTNLLLSERLQGRRRESSQLLCITTLTN